MARTMALAIFFLFSLALSREAARPRARDLGIKPGVLLPGKLNAVTDVPGVRVGHATLIQGDRVRTGVTAVLPHEGNLFQEKVPAAVYVGNGFGKLMGFTQVEELGSIETPILLTSTLNVPRVADALIEYVLQQPGNEEVQSVNPIVGECNDSFLNDARSRPIGPREVLRAIQSARSGPVEEGSVGAGTGTQAFGWKGGIGTSSRVLPGVRGGYAVGVLVQSNFGGILKIDGAPVGQELGKYYLSDLAYESQASGDGSCMMVVATDAPLSPGQLKRLAKRAMLGLAATGSPSTHGSGDYVVAFSVHPGVRIRPGNDRERNIIVLRDEELSPLFEAAKEATEEAIYNSLLKATTVRGRDGHISEAIPIDRVVEICRKYNVLK
ncbi:MAG: P1 family peptidase [Acidobacteria bacterium]|nr:P1 family peptidase [Acidobacteriota bacterium]